MGSRILLLLIASLLSVVSAGAETYSCRDSRGTLHFADSPASLPAECLGKEQKIDPGKVDNLNFVPATPVPKGSGVEFEQSVRSAEREQRQRQQQGELLQQRAEQLANNYQEASRAKRSALRRWSYSSRDQMETADQQMAQAREGKQQLLQELGQVRLPAAEAQKIKRTLEPITAE